ncbi:hypothetical protein CNMCM5793_008798 [Aspergillus hiratsukae]|uniref:Uncharacterized protein n=1 Tax=Aspergillus hiratsukae TaxID=1194566 RepID=A0A8H6UQZ0_9EURO|nr:hypothetical protein CNMCM5793_008798 [Aspergillus hiratsukae]KAF7162490.1 hypothetical protein CNMCM6106_009407 [Aspergillus hiratsukae]
MERKPALPPFPFPYNTAEYREAVEARLKSGDIDPDVGRALLEELDKQPPAKSPLERRIEELELILASPEIDGYKSGTLEYISGQYYIFKEGKRVAGPRPLAQFDPKEVLFGEFPNPRGIWIESERIKYKGL